MKYLLTLLILVSTLASADTAVRLFAQCPECPEFSRGVPLDWPAFVQHIDSSDPLPDSRWVRMTEEDYTVYRNDPDRLARKEAWNREQENQ